MTEAQLKKLVVGSRVAFKCPYSGKREKGTILNVSRHGVSGSLDGGDLFGFTFDSYTTVHALKHWKKCK